jgi:hypothetical protein
VIAVGDVLQRLDSVRPNRKGWSARCPAHPDRRPSLSVVAGTCGWPLLHCFAGCTREEILRALALDDPPSPTRSTTPRVRRDRVPTSGLQFARRQPWFREEIALHYLISDRIRHLHQLADRHRRAITLAGESPIAWDVAAEAADLDLEAACLELALEEALA